MLISRAIVSLILLTFLRLISFLAIEKLKITLVHNNISHTLCTSLSIDKHHTLNA
jgi:hypothetical protein